MTEPTDPPPPSFGKLLLNLGHRVVQENRADLVRIGGNALSRVAGVILNGDLAQHIGVGPAPKPKPPPSNTWGGSVEEEPKP